MAWIRVPLWQRWVIGIYFGIGLTWGVWLDQRGPAAWRARDSWDSRASKLATMTVCWLLFAATRPFIPRGD